MNVFDSIGKAALGSRLRALAEMFAANAEAVNQVYGNEKIKAKWFTSLEALRTGNKTIGQLSESILQTQPATSKIVKELTKAGLVKVSKSEDDKRFVFLELTTKGTEAINGMDEQCSDVVKVVNDFKDETGIDLWDAIQKWEKAFKRKSFLERINDLRQEKENGL